MSEKLYLSHSIEKTTSETSGSFTYWSDDPASNFDVGDTFRPVPDGPLLQVNKVSIKDNVIGEFNGKPLRQWEVTVEGSTKGQDTDIDSTSSSNTNIKYSFSIDKEGEVSGSMEVTNKGSAPSFRLQIGQMFYIPGVGSVTCTEIRGSDNYDSNGVHTWTTTYDSNTSSSGSSSSSSSEMPDDEETVSYELNGTTVRTVAGEFLALRRSTTPITKKTLVVNNKNQRMITTIGGTYEGGTVTRESIVREKLKTNDHATLIYYKHTIEVES